jgi:hypothetical protein
VVIAAVVRGTGRYGGIARLRWMPGLGLVSIPRGSRLIALLVIIIIVVVAATVVFVVVIIRR